MDKLIADVERCVLKEYDRASEKFGPVNNSDHESYAIILEEFEESAEELKYLNCHIEKLWKVIKCNGTSHSTIPILRLIFGCAVCGACELIQTAAMAHKAIRTIEERGKK